MEPASQQDDATTPNPSNLQDMSAIPRLSLQNRLLLLRAQWINRAHAVFYRMQNFQRRFSGRLELAIWGAFIAACVAALLWYPPFSKFSPSKEDVASYKALYLGIGQSMIGATAIATTFVLFAMQVNVEHLPHGLFRRFSSDPKLLSSFLAAILIAIALTCLSLVDTPSLAGAVMVSAFWGIAFILRLLLYAYRRSLNLISPYQQLKILCDDADNTVRFWEKRFRWLCPVLEQQLEPEPEFSDYRLDRSRLTILNANRVWASDLKQNVAHAASFARRAAERGDAETSLMAFNAIIHVNHCYNLVKGRTFAGASLLFSPSLPSDGFINDTLEHLRQLARDATGRNDEKLLEQVFQAFLGLTCVHLRIEYPGPLPDKTHAKLAAKYLATAVEALFQTQLTDSLMAGTSRLGEAAIYLIREAGADSAVSPMEVLQKCALIGTRRAEELPVSLAAMQQFAMINLELFNSEDINLDYAFGELRSKIKTIAVLMLEIQDRPLLSTASTFLAPYFSSFPDSLSSRMRELFNAVLAEGADPAAAKRIIGNVQKWANGFNQDIKDLLLLAIEKQSAFAMDLIHWIEGIVQMLMALAASTNDRDKLRRHANSFTAIFSWLPTDLDVTRRVEIYHPVQHQVQIALHARRFDAFEVCETCWTQILTWAVQAGAHHNGWGTLQRGLTALIALTSVDGQIWQADALKARLAERLLLPDAPDQEKRNLAARDLRQQSLRLRANELEIDIVKRLLTSGDLKATRQLLQEVAEILSPPEK
jgi:hypothetical protein